MHRQTDRQTDRQTQTYRQTNRQTDRNRERERERELQFSTTKIKRALLKTNTDNAIPLVSLLNCLPCALPSPLSLSNTVMMAWWLRRPTPVRETAVQLATSHASDKGLFVGWLLNVPATCKCISGTDLRRQLYVLPH